MDYIILTSHNSSDLTRKVKEKLTEGFKPHGGMQVICTHHQLRYAGMQHKDTIIENEFVQAMIRD